METNYTLMAKFSEEEHNKIVANAEARGKSVGEYLSDCVETFGKYLTLEEDLDKCAEIIHEIDNPELAERFNRIKTMFEE